MNSQKNHREINSQLASTWSFVDKREGSFKIGEASGQKDFFSCIFNFATFFLSFMSSFPSLALDPNALPSGYYSQTQNVQFNQTNNTLNVNSRSNTAIVNYNTFNVGSNATVNLNLPDANSSILNRVTGGFNSEIFGTINSNGKVFLVNSSGILFGRGSQINVGSLTASTLDITDENFLNKKFLFTQNTSPAAVINKGQINITPGGSVVLLGGAVHNHGSINAPAGQVHLAVGSNATINMDNGILVDVQIDKALEEKVQGLQDAVLNAGSINAAGGIIKAQAELKNAFYDRAVNNEGHLQAVGLVNNGGIIELVGKSGDQKALVINSGNLDASNTDAKGGKVKVLGDIVSVRSSSTIDASGRTGGGEILVGGDYLGKNQQVHNAQNTFVENGASFKTNALEAGNGGKVIIWADKNTVFNGNIEAKGGILGGNGGFVETSGKENLLVGKNATVNALSPIGQAGNWLLDPRNITIQTGGTDVPTLAQLSDNTDTLSDFVIDPAILEGAAANVILAASENINFNSNLNLLNPGVGLSASAGQDINVNASINTQNGNIDLQAGNTINITSAGLNTGNANIILSGANSINLTSSSVNGGSGQVTLQSPQLVSLDSGSSIQANNVAINSNNLNLEGNITSIITSINPTSNSQQISLGGSAVDSATTLALSEAELQRITAQTLNIGSLTNASPINVIGSTTLGTNVPNLNLATAASVSFDAGSSLKMSGNLDVTSDTLAVQGLIDVTNGTVTLAPAGAKAINVGGNIIDSATVYSVDQSELDNIIGARLTIGDTSLAGPITVSAPISKDIHLTLQTLGDIDLQGNNIDVLNRNLSLNAAGYGNLANINGRISGANINIMADRIAIDTSMTGTVVNGTNSVNISPSTARAIEVAGVSNDSNAPDLLSITATELSKIDTDNLTIGNIGLGGGLSTGGNINGDFNLTLQNLDRVTIQHNVSLPNLDLSAQNNAITLIANDIVINPGININAPRRATLHQATSGRNINLGATDDFTNNVLEISDAELDRITSEVVQVGNVNTGNITVTNIITPDNSSTLSLQANGNITDVGIGRIIENNLAIRSNSSVTLDSTLNDVDNLAANVTGGSLTFVNRDNLRIAAVDGTTGASATNGNILLSAVSNGTENDAISVDANINAGGTVTVRADNIALNANINSGGRTTLEPFQNSTLINVGGNDVDAGNNPGTLGITSNELNRITASIIQIGNVNSGDMVISANVAPTGTNTLALRTGGNLTQTGSITENNLAIRAVGNVSLNASNDVNNLSGDVTGNGSSFAFTDIDDLTIRNVDGRNGIQTANGNITVNTIDGNLTVINTAATRDINAGNASVSLTAGSKGNNDRLLVLNSGTNVNGQASIDLTADNINLSGTVTSAPDSTVTIKQYQNGTNIELSSVDGTNKLGLNDAELDRITAGTIQIGDNNSGNITVTNSINPANAQTLSLTTGASNTINQLVGSSIVVSNLKLQTQNGNINLNQLSNDVDTLNVQSNSGNAYFADADGFSLLSANLDTDNIGGIGNLTLAITNGEINQIGATGGIEANKLNILNTAGKVLLEDIRNDINVLSINSHDLLPGAIFNNPEVSYADSDGLKIGESMLGNGSLKVISDSAGQSQDFNRTENAGIILDGNITARDFTLTARKNGISQLFGSIQGANLILSSEEPEAGIQLTDADFTTLTVDSTDGNVAYKDADGISVNGISLGEGDLSITTFAPNLLSGNSSTESNLTIDRQIQANKVYLTAVLGEISQAPPQAGLTNDIQSNLLSVRTNDGDVSLLNKDNSVGSLEAFSKNGDITLQNRGPLDILTSSVNKGNLNVVNHGQMEVNGNLNGNNLTLRTIRSGDINLNSSNLKAQTSINIFSASNVNALNRNEYPVLSAPRIVIEGNRVGSTSAPIGINLASIQSGYILDRSNQTGFGGAPTYIFGGADPIGAIQRLLVRDNFFSLYPILLPPVNYGFLSAIQAKDNKTPVVARAIRSGNQNIGFGDLFLTSSGTYIFYGSSREAIALDSLIKQTDAYVAATGKLYMPLNSTLTNENIVESSDCISAAGQKIEPLINPLKEEYRVFAGTFLPINNSEVGTIRDFDREINKLEFIQNVDGSATTAKPKP